MPLEAQTSKIDPVENRNGKSPRTTIQHSLEVPDFKPPAPPPATEKVIPVMRIDSSMALKTSSPHLLTLTRGEASKLPDLPKPIPPKLQEPRILTPADIARIAYQRRHTLLIGATVYNRRVSRVHWRNPDTGEAYEALCGLDLGLLEGIGRFTHDGESYSLMFSATVIDTTKPTRFPGRQAMKIPEVSPEAVTVTLGNPQDEIGMLPINLLKDLVLTENAKLQIFREKRQHYQLAAAAWEKANPPVMRDATFWSKPHRGSRYLKSPMTGTSTQ